MTIIMSDAVIGIVKRMTRISWLEIENFRGISHLRFEPRRVNLLIGRNNSGKTSVLDAIYANVTGRYYDEYRDEGLYRTYNIMFGKPSAILSSNLHVNQLFAINTLPSIEMQNEIDLRFYDALRRLYANSGFAADTFSETFEFIQKSISYSVSLQDNNLYISIDPNEERLSNPSLRLEYQKVLENIANETEGKFERDTLGNVVSEAAVTYNYYFFAKTDIIPYLRSIINEKIPLEKETLVRVSDFQKVTNQYFNDDIELMGLEKIVTELNLVPNLERLTGQGVVYKQEDGTLTMLPYRMHGSGFFTLLTLISSMMKAKDGILLIEEPENHLHPGYLSVFVDQLMTLSEKLNVQVFMTSHSYDLIEELSRYPMTKEESDAICIASLVKRDADVELYYYSPEEAEKTLNELKIDLRGT